MYLSMAYKTSLLSERLATHVADINPLSGVQQQMLTQTTVRGESSRANGTAIRFIPGVYPHVFPEIVILEEGFAAFFADRLLFLLVLGQHVLVQVLLGHQPPVANWTLVFRFVMGMLLMGVQAVTVSTGFPAHVAHHGWFPMIQSHVCRQVALDLELLAALLAGELVVLGVLAYEMRPQGFLPRTDQAANDTGEFSLAGKLAFAGTLVILSQMSDHRGSLVATEVADRARQGFLLLRHQLHERGVF